MKTEFKGTPAPWHLSIPKHVGKWAGFNTAQGKCYGIYATNEDLEAVAMVFKDDLMFHTEQNHLLNAQLIAAAPELLETLQEISYMYASSVFMADMSESYKKAQAAINKALGH